MQIRLTPIRRTIAATSEDLSYVLVEALDVQGESLFVVG